LALVTQTATRVCAQAMQNVWRWCGDLPAGHMTVFCNAAPRCRSVWYRPRRPAESAPGGTIGVVATTAEDARRMASAARRREAAQLLRVVAAMSSYAARETSNGLSPAEARLVIIEAAGELASASASRRPLARLDPEERRRLARLWSAHGESAVEIARRLGASERSVHRWLGHP
jgi:Homeodomain-like domain